MRVVEVSISCQHWHGVEVRSLTLFVRHSRAPALIAEYVSDNRVMQVSNVWADIGGNVVQSVTVHSRPRCSNHDFQRLRIIQELAGDERRYQMQRSSIAEVA